MEYIADNLPLCLVELFLMFLSFLCCSIFCNRFGTVCFWQNHSQDAYGYDPAKRYPENCHRHVWCSLSIHFYTYCRPSIMGQTDSAPPARPAWLYNHTCFSKSLNAWQLNDMEFDSLSSLLWRWPACLLHVWSRAEMFLAIALTTYSDRIWYRPKSPGCRSWTPHGDHAGISWSVYS